jgi:hypothetical protein
MGHFIKILYLIKLKLLRSYMAAKLQERVKYNDNFSLDSYLITSGFWPRVRAPVFLGSLKCQTGRCAPPRPAQLRCFIFTHQNFPSGPNSGRQGCVYLSIGLSCTLLRSAAPNELHYTAPY